MSENVAQFLIELSKDPAGMAAFAKDPDLLLSRARLDEADRELLKSGDADSIGRRFGTVMTAPTSGTSQAAPPPFPKPRPPQPGPKPKPPKPPRPEKPQSPRGKG